MANANPLWGAPRVHGELQKLGIKISERSVSRMMPGRSPSQTWTTFLDRLECLSLTSGPNGFVDGLGQDGDPLVERSPCDCERRRDLHGLAPRADRREEQQALLEAALDDACARSWSGSFVPGLHRLHAADEALRGRRGRSTSGCCAWIFLQSRRAATCSSRAALSGQVLARRSS